MSLNAYLQRALILALVTLLRLFPARQTLATAVDGSHPHPYARMRWLGREIGEDLETKEEVVRLVLEPMAYWNASFERNFLSPGRWSRAVAEDQDVESGLPPPTDRAYAAIMATASQWQTKLWKGFSPVFPGDSKGDSHDGAQISGAQP